MTPLSTNNGFRPFSLNGVTLQPIPSFEQARQYLQQGNLPEAVRLMESIPEEKEREILSLEINGTLYHQFLHEIDKNCEGLDPQSLEKVRKRLQQRLMGLDTELGIQFPKKRSILASMHAECKEWGLQRFVDAYAGVDDEGIRKHVIQVIIHHLFAQKTGSIRDLLQQIYPSLAPLDALFSELMAPLIGLKSFFSFLDQENRDIANAARTIQGQKEGSWIKDQFLRLLADDLFTKEYKEFYKQIIRQYPAHADQWMQIFSERSEKIGELYEEFIDEVLKEKMQEDVSDAFIWISGLSENYRDRAYWILFQVCTDLEPQKTEAFFRAHPDKIFLFVGVFEEFIPNYLDDSRDDLRDYSARLLQVKTLADHLIRCNLGMRGHSSGNRGQSLSEVIQNTRPALCGHLLQKLLNEQVKKVLFEKECGLFDDLVAEEERTENTLEFVSSWIPLLTDNALQDQIRVSSVKFYAVSSQFEKADFVLSTINDPRMQVLAFEHLAYHCFLSSIEEEESLERKSFLQKQAECYLQKAYRYSPATYNDHLNALVGRLLSIPAEETPLEIYEIAFRLVDDIDELELHASCLEEMQESLQMDLEEAEDEERKSALQSHLAKIESMLEDGLSEFSLSES